MNGKVMQRDPWDPLHSLEKHGRHILTSVEMTVTNLCNMRCEHCAVGYALSAQDGERIPLEVVLRRLDEVEHLQTISITGGEPSYNEETVRTYILPVLRYAKERGVKTQINSNVTMELSRYERIAPYLDVLHISFNYTDAADFHAIGFAGSAHSVGRVPAGRMYERMISNAAALSRAGVFVSAESMINYRTHEKIGEIHRLVAEMGCKRHEVHPMYPSAFASSLPQLSLAQVHDAIHRLLDVRDPDVWLLFGTLPFFACTADEEALALLRRLRKEPDVTLRGDPDGRNRLNVNLFTGDVYVTDFDDMPPLGNVLEHRLEDVFEKWTEHPLSRSVSCYCPEVGCCGPNLLVARMYYPDVDFTVRKAQPLG